MDEPLMCWVFFFIIAVYGFQTSKPCFLQWMKNRLCCGKWHKVYLAFAWYNVAALVIVLFMVRTLYDIVLYDYVEYHLLDNAMYNQTCTSSVHGIVHPGGIPSFLRWISLVSPVAAVATLIVAGKHYLKFTWKLWWMDADKFSKFFEVEGDGDEYDVSALARGNKIGRKLYIPLLLVGMPVVFVMMALRATLREWAIMTCSGLNRLERGKDRYRWKEAIALEESTYEQDIAIAMAFQFLAVYVFGHACQMALEVMAEEKREKHKECEEDKVQAESDKFALMNVGILGLNFFVVIGFVRTLVSIGIAIAQTSSKIHEADLERIQATMQMQFDPMFAGATVLCVINMILLSKVKAVKQVVGDDLNTKFNATRLLLLIGQGQMMVLKDATNANPNYEKILNQTHDIGAEIEPHMHWLGSKLIDLGWTFTMDDARLLNSSLLCIECLVIAIVNAYLWDPAKEEKIEDNRRNSKDKKNLDEPLLA
jgi:hypothetical protein